MVTVKIQKSVAVITPSVGNKTLQQAIDSVKDQTYKSTFHYVVSDGVEAHKKILLNSKFLFSNCRVSFVPENTGGSGYYGHRIYAAYPHLLDHDYIFFLDEDNWYKPDHVSSLVDLIESENRDFAFSLRDIHHPNGDFFAEDNCESIGLWPIFFTQDKIDKEYLVDTSSFAFTRDFIQEYCHFWHWGWGGDRRFLAIVGDKTQNYNTTGQHTLCYRLDNNAEKKFGSLDFFTKGNQAVFDYYGGYPWLQKKTT